MRRKRFGSLGLNGFRHVSYTEWGDPANPRVLVCVHGLTRNGRDFDRLAAVLQETWRVVCPDLPGRGDSDWLDDKAAYLPTTYCADLAVLLARLDVETVTWLGTSLGGIVGTALAAQANSPISRLIVNDIGPFVPGAGLQRIAQTVGNDPRFASFGEAEAYIRQAMATFGIKDDEDWRFLTEISTRPAEDGRLRLHYDPGIAETFRNAAHADIDFWGLWDLVKCPVLALRGELSDVLTPEVADEMTRRGPKAQLVRFAGVGHAPALMNGEQISAVRNWLERD